MHPIIPNYRLVQIIKGYVADLSDEDSRPNMNFESHLIELCQIVTTEAQARLPLWELEKGGQS